MAPIPSSSPQVHGHFPNPLAGLAFTLNAFGVAGFFGGETAVNAMATVIFFLKGRWGPFGGLYNTPGSLEIAKQYGQLSTPRLFRGLFPGDTKDPSQLFGLDDKSGPKFLAACSGSLFEKTGHLGHLVARMAKKMEPSPLPDSSAERELLVPRTTTPATVTIINLTHVDHIVKEDKLRLPGKYDHYGALFALIPITASFGAWIGCVLIGDWWGFSSIVLGIIANGWACFVLGSGILDFQHPEPVVNAPQGDGILWADDNGVVVIIGKECVVNAITRGHFLIKYGAKITLPSSTTNTPQGAAAGNALRTGTQNRKPNSLYISLSSILLTIQFLAQLLLIPQATVFGQLMFVGTLAFSWGYNVAFSSIDSEDIQTDILRSLLRLRKSAHTNDQQERKQTSHIQKFEFGTWTAMAVFACLVLRLQAEPAPASFSSPHANPPSGSASKCAVTVALATGSNSTPETLLASGSAPAPTDASALGTIEYSPAAEPHSQTTPTSTANHETGSNPISETPPASGSTPAPTDASALGTGSSPAPELDPQTFPISTPEGSNPTSESPLESRFAPASTDASALGTGSSLAPESHLQTTPTSTANHATGSNPTSETPLASDSAPAPTDASAFGTRSSPAPEPDPQTSPKSTAEGSNPTSESPLASRSAPAPAGASAPGTGSTDPTSETRNLPKVLNALIPNDTAVWNEWKDIVGRNLMLQVLVMPEEPGPGASDLMKPLILDARAAYHRYEKAFPPAPAA